MRVLVLGEGGREHALAWKIAQGVECERLYCLPGNPGTAQIAENIEGSAKDFETVKKAVVQHDINLVVVGPEEPLVLGLRDKFAQDPALQKVMFVGPSAKGAQLEGSKEFAKLFMEKYNIPTAPFRSFTAKNVKEADEFLESLKPPYVLKADGLAAGKGVLILEDLGQAESELRQMLSGKFGAAGNKVVIEQFLKGIEVSVFVLTDGNAYLILPEAKDYKRIGEGDKGLNTGGMGAVSPVPFATEEFMQKVENKIIKPTLKGLRTEGIDYKGFIFLGLINCEGEPYVIEYNVRMGDPETEAVMTRINSDFLGHLISCAKGELSKEKIEISNERAVTVVCVSGGYPESYKKGMPISFKNVVHNDNVKIFHSGTAHLETMTSETTTSETALAQENDKIVTSGGRVLAITANGCNIQEARALAYKGAEAVEYEGKYFRRDIGLDVL